ncbi:MAG: DUF1566 domain-containing protein [Candidatus Thermoplasmatota archaeon]|nr:DUF1566 domain-containing protein [Candidatus Thermoplasmatota archaeon]
MSDNENLEIKLQKIQLEKERAITKKAKFEAENAKLLLEEKRKEVNTPFWKKIRFIQTISKTFITIIAISSIFILFYTYGIQPTIEYKSLKGLIENMELKRQYETLIEEAKIKAKEADSLRNIAITENRKLQAANIELEYKKNEIAEDYNNLEEEYKRFKNERTKLNESYKELSIKNRISEQERQKFKKLYDTADSSKRNLEEKVSQMTEKKEQAESERDRFAKSIIRPDTAIVKRPSIESLKEAIRKKPLTKLSTQDVDDMLKAKGFFDKISNRLSEGIENQFTTRNLNGNMIVIDNKVGLTWQQSGSSKRLNYAMGLNWIEELNRLHFAGYKDWRLPTLEEAMTLMESIKNRDNLYIDSIFDNRQQMIWSADKADKDAVWYVDFNLGFCEAKMITDEYYVRAVR